MLLQIFTNVLGVGALLAGLFSTTAYFDVGSHVLDLAANFRVQYFYYGLAALAILSVRRRRNFALCALFCVLINIPELAPYYLAPRPAQISESNNVSLVSLNVHTANQKKEDVVRMLDKMNPDIVGLIEVDEAWLDAFTLLQNKYPFRLEHPQDDNFGIALYSRHPLEDAELVSLSPREPKIVSARVILDNSSFQLFLAHTVPPVSKYNFQLRNKQLRSLTRAAMQVDEPVVIMGDLNITPWSQEFVRLRNKLKLSDVRLGFGIYPTWPMGLPLFFRIPIDHFLVDSQTAVQSLSSLEVPGSDHRALLLKLAVLN